MEDLVVRRKEPHRQVGETRQKKGEKVLTMKEKKKKKKGRLKVGRSLTRIFVLFNAWRNV